MSSGLLPAFAPAALAAGSISQPAAGEAISSGSTITASATVEANSAPTTLSLEGPGFPKQGKTAQRNPLQSQTLSLSVATGGGTSVRNGTWTVTLSGGASGSRTFTTNFAPATPGGFSAQGSGAREVAFSWTRGGEPDLSGYTLFEGTKALAQIDLASACSGSSCSYGLYYPANSPGTHDYALVAHRPGGSGDPLSSDQATTSATLVAPPKPTPTPAPTSPPVPGGTTGGSTSGGGTSGSSTGGSSAGGTSGGSAGSTGSSGSSGSSTGSSTAGGSKPTVPSLANPILAQRRSFAVSFNAFSPSLGIPKLPPLPATLPSLAGSDAPLPLGTFEPRLDYGSRNETERTTTTTLGRPIAAVRNVLDSDQLAKSLAGALVLLMTGAHLRRFVGAQLEE